MFSQSGSHFIFHLLIDLLFFLGKDASRPVTENGITHDTVMQMVENFQGKDQYMDNFYTSPTLSPLCGMLALVHVELYAAIVSEYLHPSRIHLPN